MRKTHKIPASAMLYYVQWVNLGDKLGPRAFGRLMEMNASQETAGFS